MITTYLSKHNGHRQAYQKLGSKVVLVKSAVDAMEALQSGPKVGTVCDDYGLLIESVTATLLRRSWSGWLRGESAKQWLLEYTFRDRPVNGEVA